MSGDMGMAEGGEKSKKLPRLTAASLAGRMGSTGVDISGKSSIKPS
jgi:hypothetical protein